MKPLKFFACITFVYFLLSIFVQFSRMHATTQRSSTETSDAVFPIILPQNETSPVHRRYDINEVIDLDDILLEKNHLSTSLKESLNRRNATPSIFPVIIGPKEAFLWKGAQSRLCESFKRGKKKIEKQKLQNVKIHAYLQLSCESVHRRNQHGNYLIGFYGMRLAALHFGAGFTFRCNEDFEGKTTVSKKKRWLLWWLQTNGATIGDAKSTARSYHLRENLYDPPIPSKKDACQGMGKIQLHYSSEYARRDLRVMAAKLRPSFRSSFDDNRNQSWDLDDVAIHFRCGDVISKQIPKTDNNYGLLQFQAYQKRIPESVKTIGIVTAPFTNSSSVRYQDRPHIDTCKNIVERLVSYLQQHFPNAKVRVRNDPKESIPKVMSRLILANYTFCARSTFCLFPAMASFGTSYVQEQGVAYFFDAISKAYDNIHLMQEPFLKSAEINEKGINHTLEWLVQ
jgi:hypothetical protein